MFEHINYKLFYWIENERNFIPVIKHNKSHTHKQCARDAINENKVNISLNLTQESQVHK